MKKTISILLSIIMLVSIFSFSSIPASAATDFYGWWNGDTFFEENDEYIIKVNDDFKTASIVQCKLNKSTLNIPSKLDGYTITGLHEDYQYILISKSVKTINIPDTIKDICSIDGEFPTSSNIKAINIDKNNKAFSSKDGVLYNKKKTELLYYPHKKTNKTFTIPKSVNTVRNFAFSSNNYLTSLTIPNSVKKITESPQSPQNTIISYCKNLKTVKLGTGIKSLSTYNFISCPNLTNIIIPKGVTVYDQAISGCPKVKSPVLSNSLKLTKGKNYIKVSWKRSSKSKYYDKDYVKGYEIQYSTNKDFKNKSILRVYSEKTTSAKTTNIKGNKKYYFKIRSFTVRGGILDYNNFSSVKTIKTPKNCKVAKNLSEKQVIEKVVKKYKLGAINDGKFKFGGKSYYSLRLVRHIDNHYSTCGWIILSLDGTEMFQGHYDFNNKKLNIYH